MSIVPSVKYVKVGGSMVAKPVNVRVAGVWKPVQNITGELYVTPDGGTYNLGDSVIVQIRQNTLSTASNAMQVILTYPTAKLTFQSSVTTGTPYDTPAFQNTGGSGTVSVAMFSTVGAITGDQLITTVTFTVVGTGTATLALDPSSGIARTSDSTPICNQLLGASLTLQ